MPAFNSAEAEAAIDVIEKALPRDNTVVISMLQNLKTYISELEYLISDLAEGLEDDDLNARVETLLCDEVS